MCLQQRCGDDPGRDPAGSLTGVRLDRRGQIRLVQHDRAARRHTRPQRREETGVVGLCTGIEPHQVQRPPRVELMVRQVEEVSFDKGEHVIEAERAGGLPHVMRGRAGYGEVVDDEEPRRIVVEYGTRVQDRRAFVGRDLSADDPSVLGDLGNSIAQP